ncbi:MAG: hypothetical protein GQ557_00160 [Mycoplasmataceae bacterium]|nr:hypothetical protein [Mycoplasmataceae bacterium]
MSKKQLNIRLTDRQKSQIKYFQEINRYETLTKYIIDASLNKIKNIHNGGFRVVTLTLNPSIDYVVNINKEFEKDIPNRFLPSDRDFMVAGKGINEAIVLNKFGINTLVLHYSGGFTGDWFKNHLDKIGLNHIQFKSQLSTRINLKLNLLEKDSFESYILNEEAPVVNAIAVEKILKEIQLLQQNVILSISGSFSNENEQLIDEIAAECFKKNVQLVFNLSHKYLLKLLKYQPYLVKISLYDLKTIFEKDFKKEKEIIDIMYQLSNSGARNICIQKNNTFYFLTEKKTLYKSVIKNIKVINHNGTGSSFVGAFLANLNLNSLEEQLQWALAAVAATMTSSGIADLSDIKRFYDSIKVHKI